MNTDLRHAGLLLACLLVGCAETADYEPPQSPPPPPPSVEPAPLPEPYAQATSDGQAQPGSPQPSPPPPPADPGPAALPPGQTTQAPPAAPTGEPAAPPAGQASPAPLVYSYPSGQWVYLSGTGWVWIPAGAATTEVEGAPYAYLYTPAYGWTWYVSPWGWGPYHYGIWARHPWHPVGWHGHWVAHPRVVVRLGRGHYSR